MSDAIKRKVIDRPTRWGNGDMPKGPKHPRGSANGAPIHKPLKKRRRV